MELFFIAFFGLFSRDRSIHFSLLLLVITDQSVFKNCAFLIMSNIAKKNKNKQIKKGSSRDDHLDGEFKTVFGIKI